MKTFLLLLLGAILESAGDVGFKLAAEKGSTSALAWGLALYAAGSVAWIAALWKMDLGTAVAVFTCLNVGIAVLAGIILFRDKATWATWVGLAMAAAAIILLEASGGQQEDQ